MTSNYRVMLIYLSCIYGGIPTHITIAADSAPLVVSPFINPRFGPNMSSAAIMSYLVTGKFGSWLPLIILRQSCYDGLPVMFSL